MLNDLISVLLRCKMMTSRKTENARKSGFKKNGLQIITRERVRFNTWEMLLHRLSPICVSRSNSLIFNFANKKRVWQEVHSKCCSTWTAARRKTVLSLSWDEWQSTVLWHSSVASRPFRSPFRMRKATGRKARVPKHGTSIWLWIKSRCKSSSTISAYPSVEHT